MKKVCSFCGVEFIPEHGNQKYCSDDCRSKGYKELHRIYYQKNKEKIKKRQHNYWLSHKEQCREYWRERYHRQKMSFLDQFFEETDLTPLCNQKSCETCPYEDCIA